MVSLIFEMPNLALSTKTVSSQEDTVGYDDQIDRFGKRPRRSCTGAAPPTGGGEHGQKLQKQALPLPEFTRARPRESKPLPPDSSRCASRSTPDTRVWDLRNIVHCQADSCRMSFFLITSACEFVLLTAKHFDSRKVVAFQDCMRPTPLRVLPNHGMALSENNIGYMSPVLSKQPLFKHKRYNSRPPPSIRKHRAWAEAGRDRGLMPSGAWRKLHVVAVMVVMAHLFSSAVPYDRLLLPLLLVVLLSHLLCEPRPLPLPRRALLLLPLLLLLLTLLCRCCCCFCPLIVLVICVVRFTRSGASLSGKYQLCQETAILAYDRRRH